MPIKLSTWVGRAMRPYFAQCAFAALKAAPGVGLAYHVATPPNSVASTVGAHAAVSSARAMMTTLRIDPSVLASHENIGLQFSGGKDSLAVAYLMRPYWDQLTFYHLDAGDLLPEMQSVVSDMARRVPRFVRIPSDSRKWADQNGQPSDLVPYTGTRPGILMGGRTAIASRWECCGANLWIPMHLRMVADKITLVIRGTKRCDMARLPATNGDQGMGYRLWLPIEEWSHDDVFGYLREAGVPLCRVYDERINAPECATCPAWWNEGRATYLKKHHPELFAAYADRLATVAREVEPIWATLAAEVSKTERETI